MDAINGTIGLILLLVLGFGFVSILAKGAGAGRRAYEKPRARRAQACEASSGHCQTFNDPCYQDEQLDELFYEAVDNRPQGGKLQMFADMADKIDADVEVDNNPRLKPWYDYLNGQR